MALLVQNMASACALQAPRPKRVVRDPWAGVFPGALSVSAPPAAAGELDDSDADEGDDDVDWLSGLGVDTWGLRAGARGVRPYDRSVICPEALALSTLADLRARFGRLSGAFFDSVTRDSATFKSARNRHEAVVLSKVCDKVVLAYEERDEIKRQAHLRKILATLIARLHAVVDADRSGVWSLSEMVGEGETSWRLPPGARQVKLREEARNTKSGKGKQALGGGGGGAGDGGGDASGAGGAGSPLNKKPAGKKKGQQDDE